MKYNSVRIVLIENYPCDSKNELHARERYYVNNIDCVNKNKPCTVENASKLTKPEYNSIYRTINSDKIKRDKSTRILCSCGKTTDKSHETRHYRSKRCIKYHQDHMFDDLAILDEE
jgi:hypothetical protein